MQINANKNFTLILQLFGMGSLFLVASLCLHIYFNDRFSPQVILESHLGSQVTISYFRNWPDHFKEPGHVIGFLKTATIHLFAFSLYGFSALHLLLSVHGKKQSLRLLSIVYFFSSIGTIIPPLLFFILPLTALLTHYLSITLFLLTITTIAIKLLQSQHHQ